jgi:uncharacterized membrane protein YhaH (DUF805 family)
MIPLFIQTATRISSNEIVYSRTIGPYEIILLTILTSYILSIFLLRRNWNKIQYPHFWLILILLIPFIGSMLFVFFLGKIKEVVK